MLETGGFDWVLAVAFHPDGKHLLGGSGNGIRRWRFADGQEVGKQTITSGCNVICISRDGKWVVCGTDDGASVWSAELHEKFIDVGGGNTVYAVDVSPDSTRFATGTDNNEASIWDIATGERPIGPLKHGNDVTGIRFSPDGEHIATTCDTSIRIFDSHNGDELVTIHTHLPRWGAITPVAWSSDGQQTFAASRDNKIKAFDTSTGTQLTESQILHGENDNVHSIALAADGKFIVTFAGRSIWCLDTSTLARIGPVIEDVELIRSIAISLDSTRLATGRHDGRITIHDLSKILPNVHGPFNVSITPCILSPVPSPTVTTCVGIYSRTSSTRPPAFDIRGW